MAYAPPVTFLTGTTLQASDVEANLIALKKYIDGGVAAGDLDTKPWVDRTHLMRGRYNPIQNQYSFISGINAGQAYGRVPTIAVQQFNGGIQQYTYLTKSNSDPLATGNSEFIVPQTSFTFTLEQASVVYYQFNAFPISFADAVAGQATTELQVVVDGTTEVHSSISYILEETNVSISKVERHLVNTYGLWTSLSAGTHHISIYGSSTATKAIFVAWTLSLEALAIA